MNFRPAIFSGHFATRWAGGANLPQPVPPTGDLPAPPPLPATPDVPPPEISEPPLPGGHFPLLGTAEPYFGACTCG